MPPSTEGWTRGCWSSFGFEYTSIGNKDIQAGGLRAFDAPVFPDQTANSIHSGFRAGAIAARYHRRLGSKGAVALKEFARPRHATLPESFDDYAIERLGVRAKKRPERTLRREFTRLARCSWQVDQQHPLLLRSARGYSDLVGGKPGLGHAGEKLWPGIRMQGYWLPDGCGESAIAKRSALVDAKMGDGHVIPVRHASAVSRASYLTFKLFSMRAV